MQRCLQLTAATGDGSNAEDKFHTPMCVTANGTLALNLILIFLVVGVNKGKINLQLIVSFLLFVKFLL